MVRPRAAGFRYSLRERRLMLRDAESLLERGADGVAVGALLHDGTIDCDFLAEIREWSSDRDIVFHRAFDLIDDPDVAIQQLIDCGIIRVLTAGGSATAAEGQSQIARLLQLAANRIEILPAGRISPDNVGDLIRATGCNQVHGSFGTLRQDPAGCISDSSYPSTCQLSVAHSSGLGFDHMTPVLFASVVGRRDKGVRHQKCKAPEGPFRLLVSDPFFPAPFSRPFEQRDNPNGWRVTRAQIRRCHGVATTFAARQPKTRWYSARGTRTAPQRRVTSS